MLYLKCQTKHLRIKLSYQNFSNSIKKRIKDMSEKNINVNILPINATSAFSLGSSIAVVISWTKFQSVLWAVIHGTLSWAYVIYYMITN